MAEVRKLEWKSEPLGARCIWPVPSSRTLTQFTDCGKFSSHKIIWKEGTEWVVCEHHWELLFEIERRRELSLTAKEVVAG